MSGFFVLKMGSPLDDPFIYQSRRISWVEAVATYRKSEKSVLTPTCVSLKPSEHPSELYECNDPPYEISARKYRGRVWGDVVHDSSIFELLLHRDTIHVMKEAGVTGLKTLSCVANPVICPRPKCLEYEQLKHQFFDALDYEASALVVKDVCPVCGWQMTEKNADGFFMRANINVPDLFRIPEYKFTQFCTQKVVDLIIQNGWNPFSVIPAELYPFRYR